MQDVNRNMSKKIKDNGIVYRDARRADIALRIRAAMIEKSLRNIDVAERLGVSEANVSRWLRGNQNIRIDTLYALADAIEAPLIVSLAAAKDSASGSLDPSQQKEEGSAPNRAISCSVLTSYAPANGENLEYSPSTCGVYSIEIYRRMKILSQCRVAADYTETKTEFGLNASENKAAVS